MRLLHTGDWHVGRAIRGRARTEEFDDALTEVVGIARQEGVDAVLLAGDLYDHRSPAPEADALVFEALVRLYEAHIPAVVIPGNHDSALRLEALAKLLAPIGVTVVPRVTPPDQGGLVEVPAQDGTEAALVACVPFVPERRFGDAAALFRATEEWYQGYAEGMGRLLAAMTEPFREDRVNVLLAHLFTDGAIPGGGEHQITIGIEYAISPSRLPPTASYVALGHVHRPQAVRGAPSPTRYAGSLLQLDFGEMEQTKSVAIVDASPGRPAKVREIPLFAGRRLIDVEGSLDEVLAKGRDLPDAYLRVFVSTDGPVPGMAAQIRDALPNAVDVSLRYERTEAKDEGRPLSSLQPRDQFLSYYRREHGVDDVPHTLVRAFDEVLEDIGQGS
ncbi:MAG: exonuclease SbcCD subunit D [Actinobacteria bacterium]|nr:exonuclease SbcCD subunit D [Actinomycetota bacterium]MBA3727792.1 exonuclease SbcCD subunit D [Actinomycetota bacterium]